MSEIERPAAGGDTPSAEDARVAFQVAVTLWTHAVSTNWSRFHVMLVANTIIIAVIGLASADQNPQPLLSTALALAGLCLCAVWFIMLSRGSDWEGYYIMRAWELEDRHLRTSSKVVSGGDRFRAGEPVTFTVDGKSVSLRMTRRGRALKFRRAGYAIIGIFVSMYSGILASLAGSVLSML